MTPLNNNLLALDVGSVRIGVAVASAQARLATPLTTIAMDDTVWDNLTHIINAEQIGQIVVGLPRNLNGDPTQQTASVEAFVALLRTHTTLPITLQDEALTSRKAEEELAARAKKYTKGDIDALAASYILDDYLQSGGQHE